MAEYRSFRISSQNIQGGDSGALGILFGPLIAMLVKVIIKAGFVPLFVDQEEGEMKHE